MSLFVTFLAVCAAGLAQGPARQGPTYPHPGWKPSPPQTAMPRSTLVVEETKIVKARFPAIDIHFHGGFLRTAADYRKLTRIMDQVGIAMLVNLDGGFGERFDQYIKVGEPYRHRIITFARLDWTGVNEPGWAEKTEKELERKAKTDR